jgi:signal transduction histidine kinase
VLEFFSKLLETDFMPHGHCYFWRPEIVGLHVVSDALTAIAYFVIPLGLIQLVRKRADLAFHWMFVLFGIFILACGTTHLMAIWTLWHPVYRLDGVIKAITAIASVPTALLLMRMVPQAVALPSPSQLSEANRALEREIAERKAAEEQVRVLNADLERRVAARTQELEDANQALQRANRNLEEFAYSASHDLKEPLRNVAIYSQLFQSSYAGKLDEEADMYLGYMVEGAQRMDHLIANLLEYTQIVSLEPETPELAEVDAEGVLDQVLKNLHRSIQESDAIVTRDPLPRVRIKELHLEQLLQNLIDNAIKYRRDGVPPRVHVTCERRQEEWRFSVRDDGIGIAPDHQEQIFGLFKRLHARDGRYSGTGIGLAICQRIVERYRGRIWVDSKPGQDTTFHFTLPADSPESE